LKKLVRTLAVLILVRSSSSLVRMFISMISRSSSKLGHVTLKFRSLGQVIIKAFLHSSGLNFGLHFHYHKILVPFFKLLYCIMGSRVVAPESAKINYLDLFCTLAGERPRVLWTLLFKFKFFSACYMLAFLD
jgi:hypothetical protein